jgi:hypothetical protein
MQSMGDGDREKECERPPRALDAIEDGGRPDRNGRDYEPVHARPNFADLLDRLGKGASVEFTPRRPRRRERPH